jgi:hypothetical protein
MVVLPKNVQKYQRARGRFTGLPEQNCKSKKCPEHLQDHGLQRIQPNDPENPLYWPSSSQKNNNLIAVAQLSSTKNFFKINIAIVV